MTVPVGTPDTGLPAGSRRWSFANAQFDERTLELTVDGTVIALERKVLEVLRLLLHRAGEVVTKDELLENVWPGRILSESVLAKAVSRIRESLRDDQQQVIKTVHGYGYRLIAPVAIEAARGAAAVLRSSLAPGMHPPLRPMWSLVERLGSGGQGDVWLGRHDKTREQRVYKFALEGTGLANIKREITLNRFLRDALGERDDLVRLVDWNLDEPPYFLELEYAAGGNLEAWADAQGGLAAVALDVRLEIVARIADVLAAAHSVGVLHKDLKPSNVLVMSGGEPVPRIRLTDFGSGGVLDLKRFEELGITRLGFTKSVVAGDTATTPLYLAPEVMTGQPATVQADVYSLGVVLYQMVVGDLKRPLAPGWELEVSDPLLSEDIALAVAGDRGRRLGDAGQLAGRLRNLEVRRRERHAHDEELRRLESEKLQARERVQQAEVAIARLRARRRWMLTALSILIVGFALSVSLYVETRHARNEAANAAATSRSVADFLSKDMFAAVGERPLRDLTVPDLVEAASRNLPERVKDPAAAAEIHAALGRAFWTMERPVEARQQLDQALGLFEQIGGSGSEAAVATAAQRITVEGAAGRVPDMARYESVLTKALVELGPRNTEVLNLRFQIARRYPLGADWRPSADELAALVADAKADPERNAALIGDAEVQQGRVLRHLGEYRPAIEALRDALTRLAATFGPTHVAVAGAHAFLGQVLIDVEQFDQAENELARSLDLLQPWVVDQNSAQILTVRFYQGQLRTAEHRTSEAISLLEHAVAVLAASDWAKTSDHTYELRFALAQAYSAAGRHQDARSAMQKALDVSTATLGAAHPITQQIRIGLADLVRATSSPEEARMTLAGVDLGVIASLGSDHPFLAEFRRVDGLIALDQGRRADARAALAEALRIFQLRYGKVHALSVRAAKELGAATALADAPR